MKIQNAIALGSFAFLFSLSTAHAQIVDPNTTILSHEDPTTGEDDHEHDLPENDPSPTGQLTLHHSVSQQAFTIDGTLLSLAEKATVGFLEVTNPLIYSIKYFSTPQLMKFGKIVSQQPEMFQYFKINQHRFVPQKRYGPSTVNANHEYKGISDRKFGFCWGYATFVRFFTQVAFYDSSLPRPDLKTIYAKIDQVVQGNATVFEGFSNLRELSLIPQVEFYLKLTAMELWRARAVTYDAFKIMRNSTNYMSFDEVENFMKDLEIRHARGELPKIVFASLIPSKSFMGMNMDIHVVPAYSVERLPNHCARIHLWDINFYTETLEKEPKYLEIDKNHGIHYAPYYEADKPYSAGSDLIGRMVIAPENDRETAKMLQSLKGFCTADKTSKYCKRSD